MMREVYRGRFQPEKGHQECVKRRAALSLSMSGACKVIKFYIIVYFITIIIISPCHPLHNLIFFLIPFRYIYYLNLIIFHIVKKPFRFHYTEISMYSFFCLSLFPSLSAVILYCFLFSILLFLSSSSF